MSARRIAVAVFLLVASLPVAVSAGPGPGRAALDPLLQRRLERAAGADELTVLVHGRDIRAVEGAVRRPLLHRFASIGVGVVRATPNEIRALAADPRVDFLEADRPIGFFLDRATAATRVNDVLYSRVRNATGIDGRGVSIAIVDTGVDGTHPMLMTDGRSKVVRNVRMICEGDRTDRCPVASQAPGTTWVDMTDVGNDTDTISLGGHGTHVTGIAAGVPVTTANGIRMHGVAPGAKIVGVSIGAFLNVVAGAEGLNWVLEHHRRPCGPTVDTKLCPPIKIVSNSWGVTSPGDPFDARRAIPKIEHALVDAGVTVVWAAGNSGGSGSDDTTNSDANSPRPGILSVANYDDVDSGSRNHVLAPSSSRGARGEPLTYPDLSAPGTNVLSSCRLQMAICRLGPSIDANYSVLSGTSMAAPHVAGVVALLLQANPKLTPAQIEDILEDTSHAFTSGAPYERDPTNRDDQTSFDKGHGLVDAAAAVARAKGTKAPAPARECVDDAPLMVDPPRDADAVAMGVPGTASDDLDLIGADAVWDGSRVRMSVRFVRDSAGIPPSSRVAFSFGYAHRTYAAEAARDAMGAWTFGIRAQVGAALKVPVRGAFDARRKQLDLVWTTTDFNAATAKPAPRLPEMRRGAFAGPFEVVAGVAPPEGDDAPAADRVASACFVQMGAGPHLRPAIWERLPARFDAQLTRARPSYDWSPEPVTGAVVGFGWVGAGPANVQRDIKVIPPDDETALLVRIATTAAASDFDLYVYGPDGALAASSASAGGDEEITIERVTEGVYSVVVQNYAAVAGTYTATAEISF